MVDLEAGLRALAQIVREHEAKILSEEAAKTSIVLPFLSALGYEVFNPGEVVPEFTADAVGKKGEKVDYAIKLDGEIRILIECKGLGTKLEKCHLAQLFRYFTVTKAKFAILTNGAEYRFYTDLDETNKLDSRPFFTFNLLDFSASSLSELRKFEKAAFNEQLILANAERLKYVSSIKQYLGQQFEVPADDFVRLTGSHVYEGRVTAHVREMLSSAIRSAFKEIVREAVQARLSDALASTSDAEPALTEALADPEIVTTQDEVEATMIVKAIVREVIAASRVGLRDSKSYCAVLVDDNNRKPLARLHFNRKKKYISLFDGENEERVCIAGIDDIYQYSNRLRATAQKYSASS